VIWAASHPVLEPEKTAGMSLQLIAISKSYPADGLDVEHTFDTSQLHLYLLILVFVPLEWSIQVPDHY
jgi:hypothetical protein